MQTEQLSNSTSGLPNQLKIMLVLVGFQNLSSSLAYRVTVADGT